MERDWKDMECEEVARIIMLAAISGGVEKVHLARDTEGSTVYFVSGFDMESFARFNEDTASKVGDFFRQLGGIDLWHTENSTGNGVYLLGGMDIPVIVNVIRTGAGDDIIIIPEAPR